MERRVLLALFLCFLVLYVYQYFLPRPVPQPQAPASRPPAAQGQASQPDTKTPTSTLAPPPGTGRAVPTETPPAALVADTLERDITIETDLVSAVFTNHGGVLKSWKLKRFRDPSGQYHDLVPQGISAEFPRPFSIGLEDESLSRRLNAALFKPTVNNNDVRFEYQDASGLSATKDLHVNPNTYLLTVSISVMRGNEELNPAIVWGPALGPITAGPANRYAQRSEGILNIDDPMCARELISRACVVNRLDAATIAKQASYAGNVAFGGVDDQYFIVALIKPGPVRLDYRGVNVRAADAPVDAATALVSFEARLERPRWPQQVFVGPKDVDVLQAIDNNLRRAVNFGRFDWLVVPLLTSLKWLNQYIGNYGWAIIVLTILINAAMFPLRHKSVVSMRKMQEIQPEVKAIQDRYAKLKATDPAKQKMNTELMNLYRERGVNPASGCIPMLLTMPVLFAFYSLLSVAVELRGAPFVGWITDLSARDPLYVTPILMGATMFIQQRMTPSTLDPVQQKMMLVMPIVFTFMFLAAPSGLVLYWLVSNLWAIGQQRFTNYLIGPPIVRTLRPAAERQLKRGRTEGPEKTE